MKIFSKNNAVVLFFVCILFVLSSFNVLDSTNVNPAELYTKCGIQNDLSFPVFEKAVKGFLKISHRKKNILTIIDFTKPSTEKRFFSIDIEKQKIIFKSLVAHGKNSGDLKAESFSNIPESKQSSLGFYLCLRTYYGKHGYSLYLDGLENGINDNAWARNIVMHSADYVSEDFIKKNKRLGRSFGCPAIPNDNFEQVMETLKEGSVLFIYADNKDYKNKSSFFRD